MLVAETETEMKKKMIVPFCYNHSTKTQLFPNIASGKNSGFLFAQQKQS